MIETLVLGVRFTDSAGRCAFTQRLLEPSARRKCIGSVNGRRAEYDVLKPEHC